MSELLKVAGVTKRYDANTKVLANLNLDVRQEECVAIVGASGSGKSTLLNLIGALDRPDAGRIEYGGVDLASLNEKQSAEFRNHRIGFVFQLHHLLPQCTVLENTLVPTLINRNSGQARERAMHLLDRVGLSHRISHRPGQLSGGERQRVAVARALVNRPQLLLADEPTGALNRESADELMDLLLQLNREESLALIMVTHSMRQAGRMGRVLKLEDGSLQ